MQVLSYCAHFLSIKEEIKKHVLNLTLLYSTHECDHVFSWTNLENGKNAFCVSPFLFSGCNVLYAVCNVQSTMSPRQLCTNPHWQLKDLFTLYAIFS